MALLGGSVFLLGRAIRGTSPLFIKIRMLLWRGFAAITKSSDKAAALIISAASQRAGLKRLFHKIAFWKHTA